MKKLYTTIAVVLTLAGISMGSQLLASSRNPQPPAPALVMPELVRGQLLLSNKDLDDADIIAMAPHFPEGMKDLILDNNNIGSAGAIAVAKNLNRAPGLKLISLSGNHIGVDGARTIVQHLPASLRKLHLSENRFGDAEAEALAEHPLPKNLEMLDLEDNHIGNAGAKALAKHPFPKSLLALNLIKNNIGDEGIIAIAENLKLNPPASLTVGIKNNKFGARGKQALRDADYIELPEDEWLRDDRTPRAGHDH